jgi:hypothetical protein
MSSPINQKGLIRKLEDDFEQLGQWMDILILPYLLYSWVINCYKPLPMEHQVVRTNTLWVPNDSCVSSLSSTKHLELTNKQTRFSKTNDIYIYGYIYIYDFEELGWWRKNTRQKLRCKPPNCSDIYSLSGTASDSKLLMMLALVTTKIHRIL